MKNEQLLRVTITSALNEAQKMITQKMPITGEVFDPFRKDTLDFTLRHEKKPSPAPEKPQTGRAAAPVRAADVQEEEEDWEGPLPSERLRTPVQDEQKKTAVNPLLGEINRRSLRRAIVLSEILSPPLARRGRR